MGTEENQKIALKHLYKYRKDVKEAIDNKKFFIITGNSIELFGKEIIDIIDHNIYLDEDLGEMLNLLLEEGPYEEE